MNTLLVLPNQLFDTKYIPKEVKKIIIWEHPHYFTAYKYNKLKLVLHRASMKAYEQYVKHRGYRTTYVCFYTAFKPRDVLMFDSPDGLKFALRPLETPNFLIAPIELQQKYLAKTDKFFFNGFYMFFKKELGIMPEAKSMDKYNRKAIPANELKRVPAPYYLRFSTEDENALLEAIAYVRKYFNKNPGPPCSDSLLETWNWLFTMSHGRALWKYFIKNKLNRFADYQDYIYFDESAGSQQLYHSGISSSLNIGLLNPHELLPDLLRSRNFRAKEAFIRQLFWREYQLYCYRYCKDLFKKSAHFGNGKKSLDKSWYSIDSRHTITPLRHCIRKAWRTGYLHHIERLMIIGNYMLLAGIKLEEGFRWFMEFSVDAYEWVMHQNVYDMVFFKTGGKTTRRPYISSSNYIIRMSNLSRKDTKSWDSRWDELYYKFLEKNKRRIGYPYEKN